MLGLFSWKVGAVLFSFPSHCNGLLEELEFPLC